MEVRLKKAAQVAILLLIMANTCSAVIYGCSTYASQSPELCQTCANKFYLSADKKECFPCPSGCQMCNDNGACVECSSGFYLSNGGCVNCPYGCIKCSPDGCLQCIEGYSISKNSQTCFKCLQYCAKCKTSDTCDACISNYEKILVNGKETCQKETCQQIVEDVSNSYFAYLIIGLVVLLLFFCCLQCYSKIFVEAKHEVKYGDGKYDEEYGGNDSSISSRSRTSNSSTSSKKKKVQSPRFEKMNPQPINKNTELSTAPGFSAYVSNY